jgi:circadian clock protein KaiC
VVTILVGVQQGMLGGQMSTTVDASYLADNVLMLRYFEHDGEVKQACRSSRSAAACTSARSAPSRCRGRHHVGATLRGYRGMLTGCRSTWAAESCE